MVKTLCHNDQRYRMRIQTCISREYCKDEKGRPDSEILSFDDGRIHACDYEDTDSFQVTEMFINNRKQILHQLLDSERIE